MPWFHKKGKFTCIMGGRIQFAPTITGHPNKIGFIDPSLNSKKNAMFIRKQLLEGSGKESLFLWGARQTGKSTLLKQLFLDEQLSPIPLQILLQ
jgi:predicted AAA+ superfamily ATPase